VVLEDLAADAPRTRSARTGVPSRPGPTARPHGSRWLTPSRSRPAPAPPASSSPRSSIRPGGGTNYEVQLLQALTTDLAAVRRALDRVSPQGSTALVDTVYAALRLGDRRTAIVVFSDGVDNLSWLTASDVVEATGRSNAIVYGVTVRGKGDRKEPFIGDVAQETGGRLFEASSERDLRARFLDVIEDIRSHYVLRYVPGGPGSPGWHGLEVRLRNGKGDVLARPGYWRTATE